MFLWGKEMTDHESCGAGITNDIADDIGWAMYGVVGAASGSILLGIISWLFFSQFNTISAQYLLIGIGVNLIAGAIIGFMIGAIWYGKTKGIAGVKY